ncbi:MAG: hypothetical protein SFZ23_09830 [Planctomycetota bacterium]|nr:hypothetical protein [Planctomycetota bacterium]
MGELQSGRERASIVGPGPASSRVELTQNGVTCSQGTKKASPTLVLDFGGPNDL